MASDAPPKTGNENIMRHQYKALSDADKANIQSIKDNGMMLWLFCDNLGNSRELSLAKTKIEEAVMWAVKSITS